MKYRGSSVVSLLVTIALAVGSIPINAAASDPFSAGHTCFRLADQALAAGSLSSGVRFDPFNPRIIRHVTHFYSGLPFGYNRDTSVLVGRIRGVPLYVHKSFMILAGLMGVAHVLPLYVITQSIPISIACTVLAVGLVVTVLLMHEFSHVAIAARFKIQTERADLFLFGAIASLDLPPNGAKPLHEFLISIAGPAINIFLWVAGIFVVVAWQPHGVGVAQYFMWVFLNANLFLAVFNLVPVLPMDGGRALRAVLSLLLRDPNRATAWSIRMAKGIIYFARTGSVAGSIYYGSRFLMPTIWIFMMTAFIRKALQQEEVHWRESLAHQAAA